MSGKLISRQALHTALLFIVVASHTNVNCNDDNNANRIPTDVEPFLEYHFHTYFNVNDPMHVAHAIELRNEIIANCVAKKIIAVPLHYHYDLENPVLERKLQEIIFKFINHFETGQKHLKLFYSSFFYRKTR